MRFRSIYSRTGPFLHRCGRFVFCGRVRRAHGNRRRGPSRRSERAMVPCGSVPRCGPKAGFAPRGIVRRPFLLPGRRFAGIARTSGFGRGGDFALILSSKTVSRTAPGRTYAPQKRRNRRLGETALFVCGLSSERVIRRCGFCSGWQPSGSSARRVATVARGGGPFRPPDVRGGLRRRREGRSEPSVAGPSVPALRGACPGADTGPLSRGRRAFCGGPAYGRSGSCRRLRSASRRFRKSSISSSPRAVDMPRKKVLTICTRASRSEMFPGSARSR